jgi:serine/threonine protein phosphatase 1
MHKQWVIPDIHGCLKTLKALLENQIRPSKHDWFYFLGDYIDRGPDSKGVIDYIRNLQDDQYNVRLLRGNHEDYCLQACTYKKRLRDYFPGNNIISEWKRFGGKETMQSFGIKKPSDIPEKYIQWMNELEYYIELDNFLIVHAGFNFMLDNIFEDLEAMLWTREFVPDKDKLKGKTVIHGHVPINLEMIYHLIDYKAYQFIDLDNGIYMPDREGFGNLVALELNSMELAIQYNLDMQ